MERAEGLSRPRAVPGTPLPDPPQRSQGLMPPGPTAATLGLVPPGRLGGELQVGGFALPSPAAHGAGAALGGEGDAEGCRGGGSSASPEGPSPPPQLLAGVGLAGGFTEKTVLSPPWFGDKELRQILLLAQKQWLQDGEGWAPRAQSWRGQGRWAQAARGGDTASILQVPYQKNVFQIG